MATADKIDTDLDKIGRMIDDIRNNLSSHKKSIGNQVTNLSDIPGKFTDSITTIGLFPATGLSVTDELRKQRLVDYTVAFQTLQTAANLAVDDLSNRTEF